MLRFDVNNNQLLNGYSRTAVLEPICLLVAQVKNHGRPGPYTFFPNKTPTLFLVNGELT